MDICKWGANTPIKKGGYLPFYLKPGISIIEAKGRKELEWDLPDKTVEVDAKAGETYYLKLDYNLGVSAFKTKKEKSQNLWPGSLWIVNYGAGFGPVEPEIAAKEIQSLKLSIKR